MFIKKYFHSEAGSFVKIINSFEPFCILNVQQGNASESIYFFIYICD